MPRPVQLLRKQTQRQVKNEAVKREEKVSSKIHKKKPAAKKAAVKKSKLEEESKEKVHTASVSEKKNKTSSLTVYRVNKSRLDAIGRTIYKRAQAMVPGIQLSNKAAYAMSCMTDKLLDEIVERGLEVFSTQGKKTLSAWDIFIANKMILPYQLHALALARGTKEIAKRRGNVEPLEALKLASSKIEQFKSHYDDAAVVA